MKFLVAQLGARRAYAVPAILQRAGILERFYTDFAGNVGLGRWLAAGGHLLGLGSSFARLSGRRIPDEILSKTRCFERPMLRRFLQDRFNKAAPEQSYRNATLYGQRVGELMSNAGLGQATHLFSMMGECSPLLRTARHAGLTIVSEVYIVLSAKLLVEDYARFPEWHPPTFDFEKVKSELLPDDPLLSFSDKFICPSETVQDDLVKNWNIARERTALVPYGMNPRWLELEPRPFRGRVLFVGTADLRKGIHYLAMAAEQLRARGFAGEFRVAGNATEQVRRQPVCQHLNFLGRVQRDRIHEEFQAADVFVLPSLAEGSAGVTYEALAAALPVITTRAAGSVVRDGIEGRIVPERDSNTLAAAIEQLVEDRPLRERMAAAARERARDFTWEKYGERLVVALNSFPQ